MSRRTASNLMLIVLVFGCSAVGCASDSADAIAVYQASIDVSLVPELEEVSRELGSRSGLHIREKDKNSFVFVDDGKSAFLHEFYEPGAENPVIILGNFTFPDLLHLFVFESDRLTRSDIEALHEQIRNETSAQFEVQWSRRLSDVDANESVPLAAYH